MIENRSQQRLIVISVAFSSFMARLNNYTVNVSLPTISRDFNVGTGEASRIVMSYLLIITSSLLLFGKLADRLGLKRIFIIGYIVFVAGSFLCGIAHDINTLIGSRMVQGVGSAMLLATSFAIISKFIPSDRTGWAFGITSTASALGVATGAPVGGLITGYFSWHWVFLINVPIGIIAFIIASRKIPDERPRTRTGEPERFDFIGAVLSFSGLAILLRALNMGKELGWGSPSIILSFLASIIVLSLFLIREKRCSAPLLDLALFKDLRFTFVLSATFMAYLLIAGNAFLMPFYLEIIKGLNPQKTGMMLLVYSIIYVIISPYAGRLSDKIRPGFLCIIAMISATACSLFFSFTLQFQGFLFIFIFLIWLALSYVLFFSPNNNQVMSLAPENKHGIASGLFNTTTNLSYVFGVAIFETVFSHAIPGVSSAKASLLNSDIPHEILLKGFQATYIFGGLACFAAFLFSLAAGKITKRKI